MKTKAFTKLLEPVCVVTTTTASLVSGVVTTIFTCIPNFTSNHPVLFGIFLGLFLVLISGVLIQILVGLILNTDSINSLCLSKSNIFMPEGFEAIVNGLKSLLSNGQDLSIKIVCYGTSGYNGVIENICKNGKGKKIIVSAVVYNPKDKTHICESDREIITAVINKANKNKNITFYEAEKLPTMRACVVYKHKSPIWCCIQTYCFFGEWRTAEYDKAPAIFANENDPDLLEKLEKLIDDEYQRLGGKNE